MWRWIIKEYSAVIKRLVYNENGYFWIFAVNSHPTNPHCTSLNVTNIPFNNVTYPFGDMI